MQEVPGFQYWLQLSCLLPETPDMPVHLKNAINNCDAPSVIIGEFNKIKAILPDLDNELRTM